MALEIKVAGRSFPIRRVGVTWQLMQFAKAQRAAQAPVPELDPDMPLNIQEDIQAKRAKREEAGQQLLLVMYSTINKLLRPEVRDDFAEFLDDPDTVLEPDELETAIGNAIASVADPDSVVPDPPKGESSSLSSVPSLRTPEPSVGSLPAAPVAVASAVELTY